jgi:hypothetical protein
MLDDEFKKKSRDTYHGHTLMVLLSGYHPSVGRGRYFISLFLIRFLPKLEWVKDQIISANCWCLICIIVGQRTWINPYYTNLWGLSYYYEVDEIGVRSKKFNSLTFVS